MYTDPSHPTTFAIFSSLSLPFLSLAVHPQKFLSSGPSTFRPPVAELVHSRGSERTSSAPALGRAPVEHKAQLRIDPTQRHGRAGSSSSSSNGSSSSSSGVASFHGAKAKEKRRGVLDMKCSSTKKANNSSSHTRPSSALDWSTSARAWETSGPSGTGRGGIVAGGVGETAKKGTAGVAVSSNGAVRLSPSNACGGGGLGGRKDAAILRSSLPPSHARGSRSPTLKKSKDACEIGSNTAETRASSKLVTLAEADKGFMHEYYGGAGSLGWWPEALSAVEDGARVDIYSGSELDDSWLESLDNRLSATVRATRR